MKTKLWWVLAFVVGAVAAFASPQVTPFAELPAGDTIVVRYSSTGCYHFFTYEFTYEPYGNGTFEVEELRMAWSKEKRAHVETSRQRLGRVWLDKGEVAKLDALIAFYRQPPEGVSTTIDYILLLHMRNGHVVAEESFVDATGATDMRHDLLTFQRLAAALKAAR